MIRFLPAIVSFRQMISLVCLMWNRPRRDGVFSGDSLGQTMIVAPQGIDKPEFAASRSSCTISAKAFWWSSVVRFASETDWLLGAF